MRVLIGVDGGEVNCEKESTVILKTNDGRI